MFATLVYVPKKNPKSPNIRIPMSFQSIWLYFPNPTGQNVTISIIGGAINANAELLTAPTREMIDSKLGMQIARMTVWGLRLGNELYFKNI